MKKLLLFIVTLVIALNASSQNNKSSFFSELKNQNEKITDAINNIPELSQEYVNIIREFPGVISNWSFNLKNSLVVKQRLDSVRYYSYIDGTDNLEFYGVDRFTYDAAGRNTLYVELEIDESSQKLENFERIEYQYNGSGLLSVETDYNWDGDKWVGYFRSEYTYNANHQIASTIFLQMDSESGEWVEYDKAEFTYDGQNLSEYTSFSWDSALDDWIPTNKLVYAYENGNVSSTTYLQYDESIDDWANYWRMVFIYDTNGFLISDVSSSWMEAASSWEESYKSVYTYDNDGNNTEILYSNWDYVSSDWEVNSKDVMTYNNNGQMLLRSEFTLSEETSDWKEMEREENQYDSNGNLVFYANYYANYNGVLINEYKTEYTYNTSYNFNDLVLPYVANGVTELFNQMLVELINYTGDNDQWIKEEKNIVHYNSVDISGIDDPVNTTIKIMPNPANDYIKINLGEDLLCSVIIYNIDGQAMFEKQFNYNTTINIGQLEDGIYFIKLNPENKPAYTEKIIINKN